MKDNRPEASFEAVWAAFVIGFENRFAIKYAKISDAITERTETIIS